MSGTSTVLTRHLRRRLQSIPLPNLKQGTTLSIRSNLFQSKQIEEIPKIQTLVRHDNNNNNYSPVHVVIEPSWRDDGYIELQQIFDLTKDDNSMDHPVEIIVNSDSNTNHDNNNNKAHYSIELQPLYQTQNQNVHVDSSSSSSSRTQQQQTNVAALKNTTTASNSNNLAPDGVLQSPPLPTDRIMFNDGIIVPKEHFVQSSPSIEYHDGIAHVTNSEIKTDAGVGDTTPFLSLPPNSTTVPDPITITDGLKPGIYLTIQVPEKMNLICHLQSPPSSLHHHVKENHTPMTTTTTTGGSIDITSKLEGDIQLCTSHGDIRVKKLRGHNIDLQILPSDNHSSVSDGNDDRIRSCRHPMIYASSLLEAQRLHVSNVNGRFRAKQVHGNEITIHVELKNDHNIGTNNLDGTIIDTDADDEGSLIDIGSLFISGKGGATIRVENTTTNLDKNPIQQQQKQDGVSSSILNRRAVRIKSHHGPLQVETIGLTRPIEMNPLTDTIYPLIELGGVNGQCEINVQSSNHDQTTLTGGTANKDMTVPWSSCLVHVDSFAPDSVSLVTVDQGDVDLTLDRKAETDLRLLSFVPSDLKNSRTNLSELGTLLADEEDTERIRDALKQMNTFTPEQREKKVAHKESSSLISIRTKAFTKRENESYYDHDDNHHNLEYVDGWVDNKSAEPDSRFERKLHGLSYNSGGGGGKINLMGASDQALKGFMSSRTAPIDETKDDTTNSSNQQQQSQPQRSLMGIIAGSGGKITVETVSWLGAIARRYGMDDTYQNELGRTASRRGKINDRIEMMKENDSSSVPQ